MNKKLLCVSLLLCVQTTLSMDTGPKPFANLKDVLEITANLLQERRVGSDGARREFAERARRLDERSASLAEAHDQLKEIVDMIAVWTEEAKEVSTFVQQFPDLKKALVECQKQNIAFAASFKMVRQQALNDRRRTEYLENRVACLEAALGITAKESVPESGGDGFVLIETGQGD